MIGRKIGGRECDGGPVITTRSRLGGAVSQPVKIRIFSDYV